MFKTYLKCYGLLLGIMIILTLIVSIVNYFSNIHIGFFRVIIPVISMFIASIILGKKSKEKAYIEGIKFSSVYVLTIFLLRVLLKIEFNYKVIIIYIILLLTSVIGTMLGINLKRG